MQWFLSWPFSLCRRSFHVPPWRLEIPWKPDSTPNRKKDGSREKFPALNLFPMSSPHLPKHASSGTSARNSNPSTGPGKAIFRPIVQFWGLFNAQIQDLMPIHLPWSGRLEVSLASGDANPSTPKDTSASMSHVRNCEILLVGTSVSKTSQNADPRSLVMKWAYSKCIK